MQFVSVNGKSLRSPFGKFCLSITPTPSQAQPDGKVKSAASLFCESVVELFSSKKEAQPFGVVKSSLESGMLSLYTTVSGLIPKGKPADVQAEEILLAGGEGWTTARLQEVKALELQLKPKIQ